MSNFSYSLYKADQGQVFFGINFPYMDPSHISVLVDGNPVGFSFLNPTGIRLDNALNAGQIVEVKRTTVKTTSPVDFTDGSVLREVDLDTLALFSTYAAQEALDAGSRSVRQLPTGDYTSNGFKISDVADPVNPADAVNLKYLQGIYTPQMEAKVNAAANAAATAQGAIGSSVAKAAEAAASALAAAVAQVAAQAAQAAAQNAQALAEAAKGAVAASAASAVNAANAAENSKNAAASSQGAAASSAATAASAANAASTSATNAGNSAAASARSATDSANSLAGINTQLTDAKASATAAANAANAAASSATSATAAAATVQNATTLRNDLVGVGGAGIVGYKHWMVGAQNRTLLDKVNDLPSVRDFGAKGDGARDDSAAFAAAKGATVVCYVPEGQYVVNAATLTGTGGRFFGPGYFKVAGGLIPVNEFMWSTTLNVPSQFATIQDACDYVAARYIHTNMMVTIKVADGTYSLRQVNIQFHQGDQVQIIGNQANKWACVLNFDVTNSGAGFSVWRNDHMINMIDGFVLNGVGGWNSYGSWNQNVWTAAFEAWGGGQMIVGANIEVHKFYYGVRAQNGSFVYCQPGVRVYDAGDVAFFAFNGGSLEARGCYAKDAADTSEGLGFGFLAEQGSSMVCDNSTAETCNKAGFATQNGGSMWAHSCTATNNVGYGFFSNENGSLESHHCTATGNWIGFECDMNSYMNAWMSTATGNKGGGFEAKNLSYLNANSATASSNQANGVGCFNKSLITGPISGTGNQFQLTAADASSTLA